LADESAKELSEYVRTIADSVGRGWNAPSDIATEKRSAFAQVRIAKDGQVTAIAVNSGDSVYDQAATDTIRRASPFAPLPASAHVECIAIRLNFFHAPGQKVLVTTGGGISAPKVVFSPDPEYSEEARKAKLQGVCVLSIIVDPQGKPEDIKVARSLGMGLDEKAIEAVKRWKFKPAMKDGKPVAVAVNIQMVFRLPGLPPLPGQN
jgi:TonB family protein